MRAGRVARKRRQSDHRADLRGKPFIGLPAAVLYSAAFTSLSPFARSVLLEILGRFNGYNNGEIAVSYRELAERLSTSNYRRIGAAIVELVTHGLLDVQSEGKWKPRLAREYRLTFISSGKAPPFRPATNDYARIAPGAFSSADDASAGKARFAERASAGTLGLADDASAAIDGNPPNASAVAADDASTLIGKPYQGAVSRRAAA
jgi:hypothetical protein